MSKEVTTACQPKVCPGQLQDVSGQLQDVSGQSGGKMQAVPLHFTMVNVGFRVLHLQTLNPQEPEVIKRGI
jgi:hypothetical protein